MITTFSLIFVLTNYSNKQKNNEHLRVFPFCLSVFTKQNIHLSELIILFLLPVQEKNKQPNYCCLVSGFFFAQGFIHSFSVSTLDKINQSPDILNK